MGLNVVQKLISAHLVEGAAIPGGSVSIRVTQTAAHDLTGPLVLRHFERLGGARITCDLSVFYADHDIRPSSPEAVERLSYMRTAALRFGAYYSRPGNGLCHLVHLARFGVPG